MPRGLPSGSYRGFASRPGVIVAGSFGAGVFYSRDNGDHWTALNDGLTDLTIFDLEFNDGFPLDLSEVLKDQQAGMNRWRTGLRRFEQSLLHNLLNSMHANWLYAIRVLPNPDPAFAHPLFWKGSPARLYPGGLEPARAFMAELERRQAG